MEVQCFDGERRIGHIRGKMRKKVHGLNDAFRQINALGV
jgi:translation initiation factor IF-1